MEVLEVVIDVVRLKCVSLQLLKVPVMVVDVNAIVDGADVVKIDP